MPLPTLETKYPDLDLAIARVPHFGDSLLQWDTFISLITVSIGVSFIAILETLISARIADAMTKTDHRQPHFSVNLSN